MELVVVITITAVLAGVIGSFIGGPIQGYFDQARRGRLVDSAQLALIRMGRDLRASLPNSVRVSNGVVELLLVTDGERYRAEPPGGADDQLAIGQPDNQFDVFQQLGTPDASDQITGSLAIYPLGPGTDADPYDLAKRVMTPVMTVTETVTGSEFRIALPALTTHTFPYDSPTRRVFLVSGPVSWLCDGATLVRYDGYAVRATQPDSVAALDALAGATRTVVAKDVQSCNFQYTAGTSTRNAVAALAVVLADASRSTERVRLMQQIHLSNAP